jgi:hypothetical protein
MSHLTRKARHWFLNLVLTLFALSVTWPGASSAENLKPLAGSAGKYAAWVDVCSDPAGAEVRSDFLARAELLAPDEQAGIIQHFEKWYTRKKKNAEKAVENCILQGKTDCCTLGPAGYIIRAKKLYESHVASLAVTAVPVESSGSASQSTAAVPGISEQPISASNPVIQSSQIEKISKAEMEPATAELQATLKSNRSPPTMAYWDAVIAKCSGTRDPVIRHNIMILIDFWREGAAEVALRRTKESYDEEYERNFKAFQIQYCEKWPPEKAYNEYTGWQNRVLEQAANLWAENLAKPPPSTEIPTDSWAALHGLALNAGKYAGWVTACGDAATIRQDFMSAANSVTPEQRASIVKNFNYSHDAIFDRTNWSLSMMLNPRPNSKGGVDPCTNETGDSFREQYEHDLHIVQKTAAAESGR